jgi:hypothetical protein
MFEAKHISRSHSIVLDIPPDKAFSLFTPIGEKLWINGWNPEFLYPVSGETMENMVFTTDHNHERTYWSVVRFDPVQHVVTYARVTPTSRFGLVEVVCEVIEGERTHVTITYTFTALTEEGNDYIDEFTEESYREMIDSWQTEISAYLAQNPMM